jgi:hypothetical protein
MDMAAASYAAEMDVLVDETTRQIRGIAQQPVAVPGAAAGATFCSLWPTAKAVLQALQGVVGGWIKIAIGIVIAAGDAACPAHAAAKAKG